MTSDSSTAIALLHAKVLIGTDYHGEVDAVQISRNGGCMFRIVWWDGGKRYEEWVCRHEFEIRKEKPCQVNPNPTT